MMQISISPKNDNVNFEPVTVGSLQEFVNYATKFNYSTGVFKDNYRKKANFLKASSIAIDVDNDDPADNYTIDEATLIFKDYAHIIMPSKSHQKEKNGRIADRFRVILFLESPITSAKDFTATWTELLKFYPGADVACKDASRFYYPSQDVFHINESGKLWPVSQYIEPEITPVELEDGKYGQLSRSTLNFLTYGAPSGKRNTRLFKAAKDMQEQGFPIESCKRRVSSMITVTSNWGTNYLNDKDIETIESAYREAPKYQPREMETTRQSVFKFQTINQMVEEAGDMDWLVDDMLSIGGFSVISGPPKMGKSTLIRQLIKAVSRGESFLGRPTKKGGVLYLTFEEQPSILKEQFELVGITNRDNIMIHTGVVFDDRVLADLEEAIHEFDPNLVVIDTLFDLGKKLEDINSYKPVYDFLRQIRLIARNTGAHVIGVHHTNKMGSFMGSQAIYGAVDTMINFVAQKDRRYLTSTGKHGIFFNDQELMYNPKNMSYSLGAKRITKDKL